MSIKRRIEKSNDLDSYVIVVEDAQHPDKTEEEAGDLRKLGKRVIVFCEDDMGL